MDLKKLIKHLFKAGNERVHIIKRSIQRQVYKDLLHFLPTSVRVRRADMKTLTVEKPIEKD